MAKRRYVSDSFWSDMWIENLDPLEKYLYLYLITNQLVSVCGIYEIQTKRIAYETGIDKEMILKMLGRFQDEGKIYYKDGLLFIVNFVKNQSITSTDDNLRKGIEREVKELGSEKLAKITQIEGACKVVEGAYKDVPIPYFTLLNFTLPNLSDNQQSGNLPKPIEKELKQPSTIKTDIDKLIEQIKLKVEDMGLAYDKKDERNFGKHILTAKEFGSFCDKLKMDRVTFALAVLEASVKISFWRGPATGPMKIYQRYSEIYNLTAQKSKSKSNVLVI